MTRWRKLKGKNVWKKKLTQRGELPLTIELWRGSRSRKYNVSLIPTTGKDKTRYGFKSKKKALDFVDFLKKK